MNRLRAFLAILAIVGCLVPTIARATLRSDLYKTCVDVARFLGTDKGPCGRPPPPVHRHVAHKTPAAASVDPVIPEELWSAGTLRVDFADGSRISCPAVLVDPGQLLTTSACGDRMMGRATSTARVVGAVVHLGFTGTGGDGATTPSDLMLDIRTIQVRSGGHGLSLAEFHAGEASPQAASLPAHPPVLGEGVVLLDPATAALRRTCKVGGGLDEDESLYSYSCAGRHGSRQPGPGSLLFSAEDLSLVGVATTPSDDGSARFLSARALLVTPHVGRALAGDGQRVVACFNAGGGRWTIREMFACSGVWVTPRALLRCTLGVKCPAITDDPVGRAELDAILGEDKLTVDSVLAIDVHSLPKIPSAASMQSCNSSTTTDDGFTKCVLDANTSPDLRALEECLRGANDVDAARCITSRTGDAKVAQALGCLGSAAPTVDAILRCSNDVQATRTLQQAKACASGLAEAGGVAGCVFASLPAAQAGIARCLVDPDRGDKAGCLDLASPEYAKARAIVDCVHGVSSDDLASAASCVTPVLPGDAGRVAACLGNPDRETAVACLLPDRPEVKAAERIYECASSGRSTAALVENCTQGLGLDPKAQQALACAARSQGETSALLGCAAQTALPPEAARLVGCAGTSRGPTDFALCASGPLVNEEWRIAAECAVESGGQPYATAGCAATRLTVREITKCFKGQVGKDCFGPNNTIVKTLTTAFDDVIHGPGKNNEVVKALATVNEGIARVSPEAAAFIERPLGSDKALIPKARDDLLNGLHVGGSGRKAIENPFQPWKW